MSKDEEVPDWAWMRAVELANADGSNWEIESFKGWSAGKAFAAYIAQHEDEPVDPDLLIAREAAGQVYDDCGCPVFSRQFRDGEQDFLDTICIALRAIKLYREKVG